MTPTRRSWTGLLLPMFLMFIGAQFTFAAVQGNHGLFRRIQVEAERQELAAELEALEAEVAELEILTHRLSDGYLDLDLLDEQARSVLGRIRPDEVVLP
ncbi:septum formation initiator family protein [Rhodobacterales bacterium HKCCE3408]|nr:septum formation initiator family protein [Rhodobacterales bacterium HKCCE3408]